MLEPHKQLTQDDLAAVAALEQRVVAADGGRLKLEWGSLRSRAGERCSDFLWVEDGLVAGFLGIYQFGPDAELAGMVDPAWRRRGIGTALLDAAAQECRARGLANALLVVPRSSAPGAALAAQHGGVLDHSEHALLLRGEPVDGPSDPALSVRRATGADAPAVGRLLAAGFGWAPPDVAERMSGHDSWTDIVERDGRPVGTLRSSFDGTTGSVYGFVVDPVVQGRGIGRDVLRRACRQLRTLGAAQVGLEVEVENERALGLYTSLGFEPVLTEDYHRLPF